VEGLQVISFPYFYEAMRYGVSLLGRFFIVGAKSSALEVDGRWLVRLFTLGDIFVFEMGGGALCVHWCGFCLRFWTAEVYGWIMSLIW